MKLLSWMHRRSGKDTASSFKGSVVGGKHFAGLSLKPSPESQGNHITPHNNYKLKQQGQECHHMKDSTAENYEVLVTREDDEIFPGFLTIGTLSVEPVTEPPTPTFDLPYQETEGIADVKYELKLISKELEKFLHAEAEMKEKKELWSPVSTTTFSDEMKEEEINYNSREMQLYPLQEYLLGSSTEQWNSNSMEEKEKMSLLGRFKKSKITNRSSIREDEKSNKKAAKESTLSYHLGNKLVQTSPTCPKTSTTSIGCTAKPFIMVTRLKKIKRLFHKKIHPEFGKAAREPNNRSKYKDGKVFGNERPACSGMNNGISYWVNHMNDKKHSSKTDLKLLPDAITKRNVDPPTKEMTGSAGREHWINTDAEYFVLELQEHEEVHS